MRVHRPLPIDHKIKVGYNEFLVSKTDEHGNILYVNDTFLKISGYEEINLLGTPHSIVRHPDMPACIFYLMWQRLKKGENIQALVKNLARSGEYYWVSTDFEIRYEGNQKTYLAFRRGVSKDAIETIEPLYQQLLKIEKKHGIQASLVYLESFLQENQMTFNEYMNSILKPKKLIAIIFNTLKNSFRHSA